MEWGIALAEEKKRFVLYEYLLYFRKHKKYFLLIPLLTTLLTAGVVYALKGNDGYTGTSLVYTGGVDDQSLTHPNILRAHFKEINPNVDVLVSERSQVKIKVKGDSKATVDKALDQILSGYITELKDQHKFRKETSEVYLKELEESITAQKKALDLYNNKLQDTSLSPFEFGEVNDLIARTEASLSQDQEVAHRMRSDLALFEKPEFLYTQVNKENNYLKETIAAGLILGLVLAFALLIFLKYIEDARRYYSHD